MAMANDWCAVAPIWPRWNANIAPDSKFQFEPGLTVEALPAWVKSDEIIGHLSDYHQRQIREETRFAFLGCYTADADGELASDDPLGDTRQTAARYRILLANMAMWLARPSAVGFEVLFHAERSGGSWIWRDSGTYPRVRGGVLEGAAYHPSDFAAAHGVYQALVQRPAGSVGRAIRALWIALWQHDTPEVRYLLVWLLLESIFGPGNGKKVSKRIPHRASRFLSPECGTESDIYDRLRIAYDLRSRLIHGDSIPGHHDAEESQKETEAIARAALLKILRTPTHLQAFSREPDRDNYLNGL